MTRNNSGTVLITGPTGGLGRATTLAMANRPALERPDLLLVGRVGEALTGVAGDDRWAHLRDGAFVVRDKEREVKPIAHDPERERRLWDATAELLQTTTKADS